MDKRAKEAGEELAKELAKTLARQGARKLGDKMERAKRPFWRRLVAFFRREKD